MAEAQDSLRLATFHPLDARAAGQNPKDVGIERSSTFDSLRKDTFVATLAHELRQPLSVMTLAVEVVRVAAANEAARRAADVMREQLNEMSRLVEDLVDAKRLASGKVSLHKCRLDLREVMDEAVSDMQLTFAEGGRELVVAASREPMWVDGDRQRLLQVASNLLRNALKYTQPGGRITMAIERQASDITLCVVDTGRGIETEALPHIFDLFSQIRPQDSTGLGIGLSIVREIVLLHGGSIEARSEGPWKGSEFIVRMPLAEMAE